MKRSKKMPSAKKAAKKKVAKKVVAKKKVAKPSKKVSAPAANAPASILLGLRCILLAPSLFLGPYFAQTTSTAANLAKVI